MKKYLFVLAILASQSGFAEDIYKCVDEKGNQIFSNTKCPASTTVEKVEYKEATLDEQLAALAPGASKITNITRKDGDTLIDFQFTTQDELEEFMRLSQKLSGKHVNLVKVVMPKDEDLGKALVQITTKPGVLGADLKPKN